MVIDFPLVIGTLGMLCVLTAFFMVQTHRWSEDDMIYDVVNFIGGALLVYYSILGKVWPFVILNAVWALYSLKDIIADLGTRKK